MPTTIKPIIYKTQEIRGKSDYLKTLENDIRIEKGADADILLDYPVVYIHVWQSANDKLMNRHKIYIGEADNVVRRQNEHWAAAVDPKHPGNWQHEMNKDKDELGNKVVPTLYIIGHPMFHKSMTLDIENRLMVYCMAMPTADVRNGRYNPQRSYYGDDNTDAIFGFIWNYLRKDNPELFLKESLIQKSALYKASPNHKLTDEQKIAKDTIIDRVFDAVINKKKRQLVMVEGETGTGKTVLASSTFYEMLKRAEDTGEIDKDLSVCLLVNHDEQLKVYSDMARKLGFGTDVVLNPTVFLNQHSVEDKRKHKMIPDPAADKQVDVAFVDEAHLLWTQSKQSYNKKYSGSQLNDIIERSKVTVIMYDENQVLRKEQFDEMNLMVGMRKLAKNQGPDPYNADPDLVKNNYIKLTNQMRMNCSPDTMRWIDELTYGRKVDKLKLNRKNRDSKGYEVIIFDNPEKLHEAIKTKAKNDDSSLSRLIATYDWKYIDKKRAPEEQKYWKVEIDFEDAGVSKKWCMPWNEQRYWIDIDPTLNRRQKRRRNELACAEQDYSIDEVGSTFTIQGFDLAYAGVILGKSVRYDPEAEVIWFDESERAWDKMKGNRKLVDGSVVNVTNTISMHELRVLMTRGTQGLYIYACDPELRKSLKKAVIKK